MRIAIAEDLTIQPNGERQSFSALWSDIARGRGIEPIAIDGFASDALDAVRGADGFMWRYRFDRPSTEAAPRLCDAVEFGLGLPVWPPARSRLFFEDKARQYALLSALGVPHPRSWIFWREEDALAALPSLPMPIVAKLSAGVQSRGVALMRNADDARRHIRRMFTFGAGGIAPRRSRLARLVGHREEGVRALIRGRLSRHLNHGCVIFQELIEGADGDTKVIVLGERALATRRLNRPNDFRASGSGRSLFGASEINPDAIALAFSLSDAFGPAPLALDIVEGAKGCRIVEFSYTTPLYPFRQADGHWIRDGETVAHRSDRLDVAEEIFEQFAASIAQRRSDGRLDRSMA